MPLALLNLAPSDPSACAWATSGKACTWNVADRCGNGGALYCCTNCAAEQGHDSYQGEYQLHASVQCRQVSQSSVLKPLSSVNGELKL